MNKRKLYILSLETLYALTLIILSILRIEQLDVYLIIMIMIYYVITLVFQPKKRGIDMIGLFFFIFFCYLIFRKIFAIIG